MTVIGFVEMLPYGPLR